MTIFGGAKSTGLRSVGPGRGERGVHVPRKFAAERSSAPTRPRPADGGGGVHAAQPLLAPIPCVNPTVNGFTAQSKVVRKKK